jgi:hypothetical protein
MSILFWSAEIYDKSLETDPPSHFVFHQTRESESERECIWDLAFGYVGVVCLCQFSCQFCFGWLKSIINHLKPIPLPILFFTKQERERERERESGFWIYGSCLVAKKQSEKKRKVEQSWKKMRILVWSCE